MPLKCTRKLSRVSLIFKFTVAPYSLADVIDQFVEAMPHVLLTLNEHKYGRPRFATAALLKIYLYAYAKHLPVTGRQLHQLIAETPCLLWFLSPDQRVPSYRVLDRFRVDPAMDQLIADALDKFHQLLLDQHIIDRQAVFIDGTKIEVVPQKYSFVWRKTVTKSNQRLVANGQAFLKSLHLVQINAPAGKENLAKALAIAAKQLHHAICHLNRVIAHEKTGRGGSPNKRRRRALKHDLHVIETNYLPRKRQYDKYFGGFEQRNSLAKFDCDATFMRLKEDPMKNGQLKPAYNVQIATDKQYILADYVCQRPTDQKTLIPFLKQSRWIFAHVHYIAADAGYGSEQNYGYIAAQKHVPLIPYTMYEKEKTRKYRRDPSKCMNWHYNAQGNYYVDNHDVQFCFWRLGTRTDHQTGYTRHFAYYRALPGETPEAYYYAHTQTGRLRQIGVNATWEKQKAAEQLALGIEPGRGVYAQRKDEVESAFGVIKREPGFRRFHVRWLPHVRRETGLVLLAYDLRKYTKYLQKRYENQPATA